MRFHCTRQRAWLAGNVARRFAATERPEGTTVRSSTAAVSRAASVCGGSAGITTPLGFHAWRQDTHGNRVCLGFFATEAAAEARVAALQRDPVSGAAMEHHQHYWVEPVTE